MDVDPDEFEQPPYYDTLGIEITDVEPGYAEGRLPLGESVSYSSSETVAHGGAIASLADSVGYWAISAERGFATTPTIDLRIDYLAPATDDLRAEAEVVRTGSSVGVVDVVVETDSKRVATARGVFKTGGGPGEAVGEEND